MRVVVVEVAGKSSSSASVGWSLQRAQTHDVAELDQLLFVMNTSILLLNRWLP
jgi:hypothetical protein